MKDLTTGYNSLVAWMKNHSFSLWNAVGTPPLFKDYNSEKFIKFMSEVMDSDEVTISEEKKEEVITTLKRIGNNSKKVLEYISNMYLKGSGMGKEYCK